MKLTADDVREIRADYAEGKWSQHDLAYIYGVTQSTVSALVSGRYLGARDDAKKAGELPFGYYARGWLDEQAVKDIPRA